jgi:hypothetical protein
MSKIFVTFFLFISVSAFSQSAIRARQYAKEYGKTLMDKYGTSSATNLQTEVTDAEADGEDYVMEIEVTWEDKEGAIIKDAVTCVIKGVLTVKSDGTNKRFSESYRNDAIKKIAKGKSRGELLEKIGNKIVENKTKTPEYPSSPDGPFKYNLFNNNGKDFMIFMQPLNDSQGSSDIEILSLKSASHYWIVTKTGQRWKSVYLTISGTDSNGIDFNENFTIYPFKNYKLLVKSNGHFELTELQY